jgi:hypothetical protein
MYRRFDIKLAERILKIDKLRDELYEELMKTMGSKAGDLLKRQYGGVEKRGNSFAKRTRTP